MSDRNPAVERLARWVISKTSKLVTEPARWEIQIVGKGDKITCKLSVYEDP